MAVTRDAGAVRRRAGGLEHRPYGDHLLWASLDMPGGASGDDGSMLRPAAPLAPADCGRFDEYVGSEFAGLCMRLSHWYADMSRPCTRAAPRGPERLPSAARRRRPRLCAVCEGGVRRDGRNARHTEPTPADARRRTTGKAGPVPRPAWSARTPRRSAVPALGRQARGRARCTLPPTRPSKAGRGDGMTRTVRAPAPRRTPPPHRVPARARAARTTPRLSVRSVLYPSLQAGFASLPRRAAKLL